MDITDDQMRQQLEQQQQVIDALLQTRKMLIQRQIEASAGLSQQMAALSFNAERHSTGRKKRPSDDTFDDDTRMSTASADSLDGASMYRSSYGFSEGIEDDDIVYRSCGGAVDGCSATEAAQRQACLEQLEILSQITAELEADVGAARG